VKSPAFLLVLLLAIAGGSLKAAAQAMPQPYRVGLLSAGADPADQSPFASGLIRGFARNGLVLRQNLFFERRMGSLIACRNLSTNWSRARSRSS
jgi:hypothetical protein